MAQVNVQLSSSSNPVVVGSLQSRGVSGRVSRPEPHSRGTVVLSGATGRSGHALQSKNHQLPLAATPLGVDDQAFTHPGVEILDLQIP